MLIHGDNCKDDSQECTSENNFSKYMFKYLGLVYLSKKLQRMVPHTPPHGYIADIKAFVVIEFHWKLKSFWNSLLVSELIVAETIVLLNP